MSKEERVLMACPHCKHTRFIRKMYDLVEIVDEGDQLTDELIDGEHEETIFICKNCNEDLTNAELIRVDELGQLIQEKIEKDKKKNGT